MGKGENAGKELNHDNVLYLLKWQYLKNLMNIIIFNTDLYFVLTCAKTQRNTKLDRLSALEIGHEIKVPYLHFA